MIARAQANCGSKSEKCELTNFIGMGYCVQILPTLGGLHCKHFIAVLPAAISKPAAFAFAVRDFCSKPSHNPAHFTTGEMPFKKVEKRKTHVTSSQEPSATLT
jgi:hypothetical protein